MTAPPSSTIVVKRYIAPNRLASLVDRPGGKRRERAIADAHRNLEAVREETLAAANLLVDEIEAAFARRSSDYRGALEDMQRVANQIITIAGTYKALSLCEACMRLCDVIAACPFASQGLDPPLAICVRTVRLFAPGATGALDEVSTRRILRELRQALDHLGISMPKDPAID